MSTAVGVVISRPGEGLLDAAAVWGVTHSPVSSRSKRIGLPGWTSVILTLAGHWFPVWGEYRLVGAQGTFTHQL